MMNLGVISGIIPNFLDLIDFHQFPKFLTSELPNVIISNNQTNNKKVKDIALFEAGDS